MPADQLPSDRPPFPDGGWGQSSFRGINQRYTLSHNTSQFIEWMNSKCYEEKSIGPIVPSVLLAFLVDWMQSNFGPLSGFINNEIQGGSIPSPLLTAKIFQYSFDSQTPYLSEQSEAVFAEAQSLCGMLVISEIEPHHLFAALLLQANRDPSPDAYLGLESGRVQHLLHSFLNYFQESGFGWFGESFDSWERAFSGAGVNLWNSTGQGYGNGFPADSEAIPNTQPVENREVPREADKEKAEKSSTAVSTGDRFAASREAREQELCLDIDGFANAIAETFTSAAEENDFVFALFGPWGRGKSTLIKRVAKLLSKDSGTSASPRDYVPISFSAWKYPTRPEVWVHLYQNIADAAQENSFWQRMRVGFRIGLLTNGWVPLYVGLILCAVSRLQLALNPWITGGLGAAGVVILGAFVKDALKLGKQFAKSYFSMPDHAEKLGLQAVIGKDLKNLLKVWISPRIKTDKASDDKTSVCDFTQWGLPRFKLIGVVMVALMAIALTAIEVNGDAEAKQASIKNAAQVTEPNAGNKPESNESSLLLTRSLLGCLALGTIAFAYAIARKPIQHERVLLIVDDLDRCEPEQMLAVIESLRLFLDDHEMSRRLQVAMLIDRKILSRALINRAEAAKIPCDGDLGRRFTQHQEEKLFVVSLELPPLAEKQAEELARRIIKREYREQLDAEISAAKNAITKASSSHIIDFDSLPGRTMGKDAYMPEHSIEKKVNASNEETGTAEALREAARLELNRLSDEYRKEFGTDSGAVAVLEERRQTTLENVTFSKSERDLLVATISNINIDELTPRSFRAFVLRYQLVRLILHKLGQPFDQKSVISLLASRLFEVSGNPSLELDDPKVSAVVRCVTG